MFSGELAERAITIADVDGNILEFSDLSFEIRCYIVGIEQWFTFFRTHCRLTSCVSAAGSGR